MKSSEIWAQRIFPTSPTVPLYTYTCTSKITSRFKEFFPFHMPFPACFPSPRMPFDLTCLCPRYSSHHIHRCLDEIHLPTFSSSRVFISTSFVALFTFYIPSQLFLHIFCFFHLNCKLLMGKLCVYSILLSLRAPCNVHDTTGPR